MESSIVGTCEGMCPAEEITLRSRERLLHFYERMPSRDSRPGQHIPDESRVVKEFARSAAGVRTPKPKSLRTKSSLKRTVDYLLTEIIRDDRKPFNFAYDFIFDRLRAVRQEIVMQDFDEVLTIELIEPMIMFHAYSLYRLVEEPIDRFDPKICRQHLQECLKKVLRCYDMLDESNPNAQTAMDHREFIESLYLLFNLGSSEALGRAIQLPKNIKNETFNTAFTISLSFWNRNYYKCLVNIMKLPYILCAVASLHVQSIRRDLLEWFSVAYQNKVLSVSLDWLKNLLFCSTTHQLTSDLQYYEIKADAPSKSVRFQRDLIQTSKATMKSRKEHFVDCQLDAPIEDILLFNIFIC